VTTAIRRYFRGATLSRMHDVQANQMRYYHFDHQGTTQALTDSTGTVTDRFAADAWGVQVKRTGTSINRQWCSENGSEYRHNRRVSYSQNGGWSSVEGPSSRRRAVFMRRGAAPACEVECDAGFRQAR
jgi:hypothetical protein